MFCCALAFTRLTQKTKNEKNELIGWMSYGLGTGESGAECNVHTQLGGRHGDPTTVHPLVPVKLTRQSVEYLPIKPYLQYTDGRGGRK